MQKDEPTTSSQAAKIHPTAIVEEGAKIGSNCIIGPYAFVGSEVTLGDGCHLHHHATVDGFTTLGRNCELFPYACVGLKTQDLKYAGGKPGLKVGDENVFREFSTIHAATDDGDFTIIGHRNYFLAYTHVAHDCVIGNDVIMSNNATLAGHVHVEDFAILGGMAGVHQFCRIGTRTMIGGCSKVEKDIPPFFIADGQPAYVRGVNVVGLQRANYTNEQISVIKTIYRTLYRDGLNRTQALEKLATIGDGTSREIEIIRDFAAKSSRGFASGSKVR